MNPRPCSEGAKKTFRYPLRLRVRFYVAAIKKFALEAKAYLGLDLAIAAGCPATATAEPATATEWG